jgi:hypothetical protein
MKMLSDDDLDLEAMTDEELAAAWDLWFDLAQATNDFDPPWTHGVFVNLRWPPEEPPEEAGAEEHKSKRDDR